MNNIQRFEKLGINMSKLKGNTLSTICPKCSHERKKKNDPCLSVTVDTGLYCCHHCDFKGCVAVIEKIEIETKKDYFKPIFNNRTQLTEKEVNYFFKRGISQDTILKMKITAGLEYMPQLQKKINTIQFNYFRNDILVNTKFRDAKKNFKLIKDAELIFYNLDAIKDSTWCVITEGEFDALSWIESGINEVVSVPNGASKGSQRLEYLDNCYTYFENKEKIFIATDCDEAGRILRDELARRLGIDRCFWIDFGIIKDSNEYLTTNGGKELINLLETAKEFSIEGVFNIDDCWEEIENIYNNGLPTGTKTGDKLFDAHMGLLPGELTMITGIPGHGKTIYIDQISLRLCLNENWTFAICSPESYPTAFFYTRLIKRLIGKKFSKYNITPTQLNECREWVRNRYSLIAPPKGFDLDDILEKARLLVLKKGIKCLIIDPWNRIESIMPNGYNITKWVQERLDKIIRFSQKNGVHTFLVAHPTKMTKQKDSDNYLVPTLYSISGSSDFFNMTQNGLTVYRNFQTGKTEIHFQKIKWEHLGKIGMIEYSYCEENSRFYDSDNEDPLANWLEPKNIQQPINFYEPLRNMEPIEYDLPPPF